MPLSASLTPQFWRTATWLLLALLPLWLGGMFGNISQLADPAVPLLAGEPFLETPPLLYWAAAPGIALPGPAPAPAVYATLLQRAPPP